MGSLLKFSTAIDAIVAFFGRVGSWAGLFLVIVVIYDVISRYAGVPKPFGLNSTQIQESEYWLHSILFTLMLGYAYQRQAHVRIDLIRERLSLRKKYLIEMLGCLMFLIPYSLIGFYFSYNNAYTSFLEGEVSKSVIGWSNIWILKTTIPIMFGLLFLAGISGFIRSVAGLTGSLPDNQTAGTLGGDN